MGIIVGVLLAVSGYLFTHWHSARLKKLDARYDYVTAQLRDLFGPLYLQTMANTKAWEAFRTQFRPGRKIFDKQDPMTEGETKTWAYWVTHVFQPSNRRMKQVIERNAHLFPSSTMPEPVVRFIAHTDMFESVVEGWRSGDYSNLCTPIPYPTEIDGYIETEYRRTNTLHARLSGRRLGVRK